MTAAMASLQITPHSPNHIRILDDIISSASSYKCAPPSPQIISFFNSTSNKTSYMPLDVKVHEIGILFRYEITHPSDVSWEARTEQVADDGDGEVEEEGLLEKAGNFFGGLFGGSDDDDEEAEEASVTSATNKDLIELEKQMVYKVWSDFLKDERMAYKDNEGEICAGLVVDDGNEKARVRQLQDILDAEGNEDILIHDSEGNLIEGEEEMTKAVESAKDAGYSTFSGTKLLGLTYLPLDSVNANGCVNLDSTCTSINGQVSVAYSGANEPLVVQTVLEQIRSGMDEGAFLPENSPAETLDFVSAGGTAPVNNGGAVIQMKTDRGMADPTEEEESYLSRYGVLFVCIVAILGVGFLGATYMRYKRRQRRIAEEKAEGMELTEEEYNANLALHEDQVDLQKTEEGGSSDPSADSPKGVLLSQVELDVPPVGSAESGDEVEISLSPSAY